MFNSAELIAQRSAYRQNMELCFTEYSLQKLACEVEESRLIAQGYADIAKGALLLRAKGRFEDVDTEFLDHHALPYAPLSNVAVGNLSPGPLFRAHVRVPGLSRKISKPSLLPYIW